MPESTLDIHREKSEIIGKLSFGDEETEISPCLVLTKDEKYLIIFYRYTRDEDDFECQDETQIEILNIEDNSIRLSKIKLPDINRFFACSVDDSAESDVIINGYLRGCWKTAEFSGIDQLPVELTVMIIQYYNFEWVHVFNRSNGKQWTISVQDILGDNQA